MHRKFREGWTYGFRVMRADKQTDRQTNNNNNMVCVPKDGRLYDNSMYNVGYNL